MFLCFLHGAFLVLYFSEIILFCCCSSTVFSIFPPPLPLPAPHSSRQLEFCRDSEVPVSLTCTLSFHFHSSSFGLEAVSARIAVAISIQSFKVSGPPCRAQYKALRKHLRNPDRSCELQVLFLLYGMNMYSSLSAIIVILSLPSNSPRLSLFQLYQSHMLLAPWDASHLPPTSVATGPQLFLLSLHVIL